MNYDAGAMKQSAVAAALAFFGTVSAGAMPVIGSDWVPYGRNATGDAHYWMKSETRDLGNGVLRVWATIVLARVDKVSERPFGAGYLMRRYVVSCPSESLTLDVDNSYMYDDAPLIVYAISPANQTTVVPVPGTPEKALIGLVCAKR